MCDQFLEAPAPPLPGSTADIPDIFDVLAGGEDEGTVRWGPGLYSRLFPCMPLHSPLLHSPALHSPVLHSSVLH